MSYKTKGANVTPEQLSKAVELNNRHGRVIHLVDSLECLEFISYIKISFRKYNIKDEYFDIVERPDKELSEYLKSCLLTYYTKKKESYLEDLSKI